MVRRIGVLSDIHGNMPALETVAQDIAFRRVDQVVCLGDHVSGPLWPRETARYLMERNWICIAGDHDRRLVAQDPREHGLSDAYAFRQLDEKELQWLRALPATVELQDDLLLVHDTPLNDGAYLLETIENHRRRMANQGEIAKRLGETKRRVVLCGHSHIPRIVEFSGRLLINPGSVGLPAYEEDLSEYHVMETGSPHARYGILEFGDRQWRAELVALSYDHEKAAARARENGRTDWERGILRGFM